MKKVVVIGSVNQDISLSMNLLPKEGDTVIAETVSYNSGGKGANQAVALSRMGCSTVLICAVGDDVNGSKLTEGLLENGIDVQASVKVGKQTGFAMIAVDQAGHNNIIVHPGSNFLITEEDIQGKKDIIKAASYCVMQFELPIAIVESTIRFCASLGVPVVLNPAPYNPDYKVEMLHYVDYFIPNANEFNALFDDKPDVLELDEVRQRAQIMSETYDVRIIVTLGSQGSLYVYKDEHHHQAAHIVNAIDTTAAGDTYIGAFVSQISNGTTIPEAMAFATKASSITVSAKGAQESIPYLNQVL